MELENLKTLTIPEFAKLKGIAVAQVYQKLKRFPDCLDTEGETVTRIINNKKVKNFNLDLRKSKGYYTN